MITKYPFSSIHLATKQTNSHNNIQYLLGWGKTHILPLVLQKSIRY